MSNLDQLSASVSPRIDQIRAALIKIFCGISGIPANSFASGSTFLELGIDSLSLLQVSQSIHQRLGVKVPFKNLLDQLPTIDVLAAHLEPKLPPAEPVTLPASQGSSSGNETKGAQPASLQAGSAPPLLSGTEAQSLESIAQQLAGLSQQLTRLCRPGVHASAQPQQEVNRNGSCWPCSVSASANGRSQSTLSPRQQEHVRQLIASLTARTRESKRRAQAYRSVLADSVVSANFRLPWKEICYPIIVDRASGARAWDVDKNEYIDIAMGFGALLFGHSPAFVREALLEATECGMRLGFQSALAGEAASLLCELTGMERAAFCNSGTEAVMTALRVARAVTDRSRIALFSGLYHGTFDGVLAGSIRDTNGQLRTVPRASGVPAKMVEDVLVLPFGEQEGLDVLREHAHELAAVLIEPAPWWNPKIDLGNFLRQLRAITSASGSALIFDEVVVGFRMHPGGAQAQYNVRADLVTYGKAVGAGMPIGVLAGDRGYMDAIDGGPWSFGDDSSPQADTTLFAGTFFKHPMVMAATLAVLKHIKQNGPQLQERLSARTAAMASELNSYCLRRELPVRTVQFGSSFSFGFAPELAYTDLFFHHLIDRGVYVCDTRKCYLSSAHTDQDVELVSETIKHSAEALREGGFLTSERQIQSTVPPFSQKANAPGTFPMTEAQKGLWTVSSLSPTASSAYNESINIRLRGPLDVPALHSAFSALVRRRDALRTTFSADGTMQRIVPELAVTLPLVDLSSFSSQEQQAHLDEKLTLDVEQPFDLEQGPLFRARLIRLGDEHHILAMTVHHIIVDGWSTDILLRELGALYSAETLGIAAELPPPVSYKTYAATDARTSQGPHESSRWDVEDEAYWLQCYADRVPVLKFPTDRPRPPVQTYSGARITRITHADLFLRVKALSDMAGCTPFTTLLAIFEIAVRDLTGQEEMIIGVHLAGQSMLADTAVFGYCIEMLPLRGRVNAQAMFEQHLASVKDNLADAVEHHAFPISQLIRKLKLRRDPSMPPMVTAIFNMDPPSLAALSNNADAGPGTPPWWGLTCDFVANPRVFARFDQVWNVIEQDGRLIIDCTYNTDLFDASTIETAVQHFESLVEFYAATPEAHLKPKHPRTRQNPTVSTKRESRRSVSRRQRIAVEDNQVGSVVAEQPS